jgi:hypothetical protein
MAGDLTTIKTSRLDTTYDDPDGMSIHSGRPCFGDRPLLGANTDTPLATTS